MIQTISDELQAHRADPSDTTPITDSPRIVVTPEMQQAIAQKLEEQRLAQAGQGSQPSTPESQVFYSQTASHRTDVAAESESITIDLSESISPGSLVTPEMVESIAQALRERQQNQAGTQTLPSNTMTPSEEYQLATGLLEQEGIVPFIEDGELVFRDGDTNQIVDTNTVMQYTTVSDRHQIQQNLEQGTQTMPSNVMTTSEEYETAIGFLEQEGIMPILENGELVFRDEDTHQPVDLETVMQYTTERDRHQIQQNLESRSQAQASGSISPWEVLKNLEVTAELQDGNIVFRDNSGVMVDREVIGVGISQSEISYMHDQLISSSQYQESNFQAKTSIQGTSEETVGWSHSKQGTGQLSYGPPNLGQQCTIATSGVV